MQSESSLPFSSSYKLCAVIPTYNHTRKLPSIVAYLGSLSIDCVIVDDGSDALSQSVLQRVGAQKGVHLLRLPYNQGKGAAVCRGLIYAFEKSYTHGFQVDADGQHDLSAVTRFLAISMDHPDHVICGWPIYGSDIPFHRRIGRWVTNFWVWIETLSFCVKESMCGFRIYPLAATTALLKKKKFSPGMAFDTQILVRLIWQKCGIVMERVGVSYPDENNSHFRMIRDNWHITKMHTGLVFEGLWQGLIRLGKAGASLLFSPRVSCTETMPKKAWYTLKERGSVWGMLFLEKGIHLLGPRVCYFLAVPVVGYFYLGGRSQRQGIQAYWNRVNGVQGIGRGYRHRDVWQHYVLFCQKFIDQVALWKHQISIPLVESDGKKKLLALLKKPQGRVLFISHLGNIEVLRALHGYEGGVNINILMHTQNARLYHDLVDGFGTGAHMNIIEVTELGAHTLLMLQEKVNKGEWIFIAADRVPLGDSQRVLSASFLGESASFSTGPYILASLLGCPVYALFSFREKAGNRVFVETISQKIILRRSHKNEDIHSVMRQYIDILERYTLLYPHQWYNFYNFWK